MKLWSNHTHAWIGLWLLAGLAILAVNLTALMTLVDAPITGYSSQVRSADRAFQQYRKYVAVKTETIASGMERLTQLFAVKKKEKSLPAKKKGSTPNKETGSVSRPQVLLPKLDGLISRISEDGSTHWQALMDGGIWSRGDRIRELTVARIDRRGVVMAHRGRTWLIKAPEVTHSLAAP